MSLSGSVSEKGKRAQQERKEEEDEEAEGRPSDEESDSDLGACVRSFISLSLSGRGVFACAFFEGKKVRKGARRGKGEDYNSWVILSLTMTDLRPYLRRKEKKPKKARERRPKRKNVQMFELKEGVGLRADATAEEALQLQRKQSMFVSSCFVLFSVFFASWCCVFFDLA